MPVSDQGVHFKKYSLIPRTLSFLFRNNKVLLIKGAATKRLWPGLYNGIGGHIERGEDVASAAMREVFEETGLIARDFWLCGVVTIDTGPEIGVGLYVFRGENIIGELKSCDEGMAEWIELEHLENYPLVEDISILFPRILISDRLKDPFSAHYQYINGKDLKITFYSPGNA